MNELPFSISDEIYDLFGRDTEHEDSEWMYRLKSRLHQLPSRYRLQFLDAGSNNMQMERAEHLKVCQNPTVCPSIKSVDNRMLMIETAKEDLGLSNGPVFQEERESPETTKEFTTARQVLAIHYLMKCLNVQTDKAEIARFIVFLTGKNYKNTYDLVRDPLSTKSGVVRFSGTLNLQV